MANPILSQIQVGDTTYDITDTTKATVEFVQNTVAEVRMLVVNVTKSSNTSVTVTNSKITASHVPLQIPIVGASADVTVTTVAGQATIECTAGIPAFTMYLLIPQ